MIYLAWKVLGTLSHFHWWEKYASQNVFYISTFALSSDTSINPFFPLRRAFLLLYAIFIFTWVSIFCYKATTEGHYDHTWALGIASVRVWFMNGPMIEHNGLGITCFSVDILKDMVACWCFSIKVFMSKLYYCFEPYNVHATRKEHVMNMLGSIPHQKLCVYHLPTRGRAGIKLGYADTSQTYL